MANYFTLIYDYPLKSKTFREVQISFYNEIIEDWYEISPNSIGSFEKGLVKLTFNHKDEKYLLLNNFSFSASADIFRIKSSEPLVFWIAQKDLSTTTKNELKVIKKQIIELELLGLLGTSYDDLVNKWDLEKKKYFLELIAKYSLVKEGEYEKN
ncbi:Uncharacterised protein [Metamycoplasma arthritidis]|uniref:Uncharacterized protein n=1 Tax=Metamycoplasma arthritidis (strain 158L3-1) TaxID=243272 RepID=B3PMS1_META1|nr:hypothetical protein [Metamycoplasma arthritidis]ACF07323.1 conserved hypothetical protein [Metamycoplasma arthritidis 158L3-1]VEU78846.1 Uncharacterised protein [Metamycoplasma arthritidis]